MFVGPGCWRDRSALAAEAAPSSLAVSDGSASPTWRRAAFPSAWVATVNHTVFPSTLGTTPQLADIAATICSPRPRDSVGLGERSVGSPPPMSRTSTRICAPVTSIARSKPVPA